VQALPRNVESIVSQINRSMAKHPDLPTLQEQLAVIPKNPDFEQCRELAKSHNITLVYLATDAPEPTNNPAFSMLYATYPCTFTIDNFNAPSNQAAWDALDNAVNAHDGTKLKKYLIPLVDATVASRGRLFIGTDASTFSGFVSRLHDVFWSDQQAASLSHLPPSI
jgi:hypothetical protein